MERFWNGGPVDDSIARIPLGATLTTKVRLFRMSNDQPEKAQPSNKLQSDEWYRQQARRLSEQWRERLDDFKLPCPLCSGQLQFEGARRNPLFEFEENEPGAIQLLNLLTLNFVCDRCGYIAEFDAELFNPAYLAQLQGAERDKIAELSIRNFRVLVPIAAEDRADTLLHTASALASVHKGDVIVLLITSNEASIEHVKDKIQHYKPDVGEPAPVQVLFQGDENVGDAIVDIAARQRCNLLLVGWRGWTRNQQAVMGTVLDPVLREATCDVAVVHDKGLRHVRRILVPLLDSPNDKAALQLGYDLAQAFDAELHVVFVIESSSPEQERHARERIGQLLRTLPQQNNVPLEEDVLVGSDIVQTVVDEAAKYDLVVLGASTKKNFRRDDTVMKIARNSNPTTIAVKSQQAGLGTWFSRLFA